MRVQGGIGSVAELAEIAVEARNGEDFRRDSLLRIATVAGADQAGFFTFNPLAAEAPTAAIVGLAPPSTISLEDCFRELTRAEFARALKAPRAVADSDILSTPRRRELLLYRECLHPIGVKAYTMRLWKSGDAYYWITLSRLYPCDMSRFLAKSASLLDSVFHVVALGVRAHSGGIPARDDSSSKLHSAVFTPGETKVVRLLERGLTNPEIAAVLGLSPNTVRNQVGAALRRVGASRRAELVYLLHSDHACARG